MNIKESYNRWALQYDASENKTRDLEAVALRDMLSGIYVDQCLEIGCGTGKNTGWLLERVKEITAVDFSEEMLAKAKVKISSSSVAFVQADITERWTFAVKPFDLVTFSLVLEHIEDLNTIFRELSEATGSNGYVYIGELHPFKQYNGTKARFETSEGLNVLTCYTHHLSDFTTAADMNGFEIVRIHEYFDNNDRTTIPRILAMLFRRKSN